jgi:hypothetical protein
MFDKDAGRLDIVSLTDERSVGVLLSAGAGARFATLALFSPDEQSKYVLTVGGEAEQRGEMTLWETKEEGGRAAERKRLLTPRGASVTCAAFSPDAERPFVVAGTVEGGVHVWELHTKEGQRNQVMGEVVAVLPADAKSLTVRVELANPNGVNGDELKDRSMATILINPDAQPAPPAAPLPGAVRPAAGGVEPGGVIPAGGVAIPVAPPSGVPPLTVPPAPVPAVPTLPPDKK